MKEKKLICYQYGQVDSAGAEDWMRLFRRCAETYMQRMERETPSYWVIHSRVNGTSSRVAWMPVMTSLFNLVDKDSPEMWITVDAIGRIRIHIEEAFGTEVTSLYLVTTAIVQLMTRHTGPTSEDSYARQVRLLEEEWAHYEVQADWLTSLVEVPEEEPHIIADALGQFW